MAVVTDQAQVYRRILRKLQQSEWITTTNNIYVAYQPIFDPTSNEAIQVIPGTPITTHPDTGVGLIEEEFQVAVWKKVLLDQLVHSTAKITNASIGILTTITAVRRTLIQSWLDGHATVPVVFLQGSAAAEHDADMGWVMLTDTYRVSYQINWDVEDEPT